MEDSHFFTFCNTVRMFQKFSIHWWNVIFKIGLIKCGCPLSNVTFIKRPTLFLNTRLMTMQMGVAFSTTSCKSQPQVWKASFNDEVLKCFLLDFESKRLMAVTFFKVHYVCDTVHIGRAAKKHCLGNMTCFLSSVYVVCFAHYYYSLLCNRLRHNIARWSLIKGLVNQMARLCFSKWNVTSWKGAPIKLDVSTFCHDLICQPDDALEESHWAKLCTWKGI